MFTGEQRSSIREEIIEKVDIVEYISRYTDLYASSNEFVGCCPLHAGDRDPSLHVNQDKKRYHCFGCGSGGTVFEFARKINNETFDEVVERFKPYINIESLEKPSIFFEAKKFIKKDVKNEKRMFLFENCMDEFPEDHNIKEWIGEGISEEVLKKHNVRYNNDKSQIVFPIFDTVGNTISIKCRNLEKMPKYIYLNKIGQKDFLYNYTSSKEYIVGLSECILVESEKSVMKLESWGIKNCVAVGSHFITKQEEDLLIKTDFCNLIFAYDEDVSLLEIKKQSERLSHYKNIYYIPTNEIEKKSAPCDHGFQKWMELYNKKIRIKL